MKKPCQYCNGTGVELDQIAFGRELRNDREQAGINQKDMAKALGITASYLSDLELGKRKWSTDNIYKFQKHLTPRHARKAGEGKG